VRHSEFAGAGGWSLTDSGRAEGEKRLLAELQDSGGRAVVEDIHKRFLPLNARFQAEVTKWQIRQLPGDELACNDHNRLRWDDRVLDSLERTIGHARALCESVSGVLQRFDGYHVRLGCALAAVMSGRRDLVDGLDVDSLHRIWFELHEDLLATLGRQRGQEAVVE
jgi:hypothetical protein